MIISREKLIPIYFHNTIWKQDRQCVYKVTLRPIRANNVAVEKNKYYIFREYVSSLRYQAHNSHARYCRLCLARLYNIFQHCLINGMIFGGKKIIKIKSIFLSSLQLLPENFLF